MKMKNIFTALICAVAVSTVSVFSTLAVTNAANNEVTFKSQGRIVYESPDGDSAKNVVFDANDFNTISNLVTDGKLNIVNSINTYSSDAANPIISTKDANGNQYIPTFQELADAITGMTQSDNSKFKEQTAASETLGYGASRIYEAGYYPNSWTVTGKNPTGTKTITSNGTYDIKDYSSVSVSVNSSSGGGSSSVSVSNMTTKNETLSTDSTVSLKPNWNEVIVIYTSNGWNTMSYIDSEETLITPIPAYRRFTISEINRANGTIKLSAGSYTIHYH